MKKQILFLWFGDQKPKYVDWTINNFRMVNPGWDIKFISYTNNQLENYKEQNDNILNESIILWKESHRTDIGELTNIYRNLFLKRSIDLVFYCDLDCFPIAPFDNFIVLKETEPNIPYWISNIFCQNRNKITYLGTNTGYVTSNSNRLFKSDIWCICNNDCILTDKFIQIHKESFTENDIYIFNGMLMNKYNFSKYLERNRLFHECKIEIGDNFCMNKFTPVEHYYLMERTSLNKEISSSDVNFNS